MKMIKKAYLLFLLFFFSCTTNYLYVQQETVDEKHFASYIVNTPDPHRGDLPLGQKISVSWDFPLSIFRKKLTLQLTVRFWDNQEEVINYPLERKRGATSFFFANKESLKSRKILTYKVDVVSDNQELITTWKHQFWVEHISI